MCWHGGYPRTSLGYRSYPQGVLLQAARVRAEEDWPPSEHRGFLSTPESALLPIDGIDHYYISFALIDQRTFVKGNYVVI